LVALMGPTGVRIKIPQEPETILIIGGLTSFAFLRCYGQAARSKNHKIIYLSLADASEIYCQAELEQAADHIIWLSNQKLAQIRTNDAFVHGKDIFSTLKKPTFSSLFLEVDRIFLVGETELLRQFQINHKSFIPSIFKKQPKIVGSVYGNMQCMLKGVCAQCLQWQIDPITKERTKAVFACSWQDQPLEIIDIEHIDARKNQNKVLDHLNNFWLDHLFSNFLINKI
jgi:hypothetical protein